jgi:hypothetical protein
MISSMKASLSNTITGLKLLKKDSILLILSTILGLQQQKLVKNGYYLEILKEKELLKSALLRL